ncbi:histone-arginine methyltransferase CARM1 [Gadus morhua]|nr:histone-arginine methyltransferase CARM1-like [Gadus morhua]
MASRSREEMTAAVFPVRVFTLEEEEVEEQTEVEEQREEQEVEEQQRMQEALGGAPQVTVRRHRPGGDLTLMLRIALGGVNLRVQDGDGGSVFDISFTSETSSCRVGSQSLLVNHGGLSILLLCKSPADVQNICQLLFRSDNGRQDGRQERPQDGRQERPQDGPQERRQDGPRSNTADRRMAESVAMKYFMYPGCLSQQQNLLQDYQRTATYQRAFLDNEEDFRDKVVLCVGGGSGILSFFAVQAGAKRVYAVETPPIAEYLKVLLGGNGLSDRVTVLEGGLEKAELPEEVDLIVSEPIGYLLLHERKLDSFLLARKWLKPKGLMFPSSAEIHLAPFTDDQLYIEQHSRTSFWQQRGFHGINLCGLHTAALNEVLRQPIVDTFDMAALMASSARHRLDFIKDREESLHRIEIPFVFRLLQSGLVHGLAFWFDVAFTGSSSTVWLSTAPTEPLTQWYQVRCLLQTPLFAKLGQTLSGTVLMTTNQRHSYDIHITATVDQSGFRSGNLLDLKNPFFRMPTWLHG